MTELILEHRVSRLDTRLLIDRNPASAAHPEPQTAPPVTHPPRLSSPRRPRHCVCRERDGRTDGRDATGAGVPRKPDSSSPHERASHDKPASAASVITHGESVRGVPALRLTSRLTRHPSASSPPRRHLWTSPLDVTSGRHLWKSPLDVPLDVTSRDETSAQETW